MYCVLLTIFKTNFCPYGLVVSGKDGAHADEKPKDRMKRETISLLQKWQH